MSKKPAKREVRHFNDPVVARAFKLSRQKEGKTLPELLMKTGEELGEMFQAYLSMTGAPANKWRGKTQEDLWEEMVDLHLCNIAVMARANLTQAKYRELMAKKLKQWESKLDGTYKKPMKKVFILYGDNPGDGSAGVYSSREAAEKIAKALQAEPDGGRDAGFLEYSIDEREIED